MKALVFRHNLAREAVSAIGGHVDRHAFVSLFALSPGRTGTSDRARSRATGL